MPSRLVADAGGVEIEIVDVRPAAGGDQKVRSFDRFASTAFRFGDDDLDARQHAAHLRDLHPGTQLDALAGERVEHDGRAFAIFAPQRRRRFEHGDFGAEAAKCLRQFEADRCRRR